MKESDVRTKIRKALEPHGYWPITNTDTVKCSVCGNLYYPKKGRPDLICIHPNALSMVAEVKVLYYPRQRSFPFNEISPEQRRWLDAWMEEGGRGYIGLGVINKREGNDKLLGIYLIDWSDWYSAEVNLFGIQESIPYEPFKGMRKAIGKDWCITKAFRKHLLVDKLLPPGHSAIRYT